MSVVASIYFDSTLLESPGVAVTGLVELAKTVGARGAQPGGNAQVDRHSILQLSSQTSPLPYEGPHRDDCQLRRQENGPCHNQTRHVDAQSRFPVGDEDRLRARFSGFVCAVEAKFVRYLDGLDEEHVFLGSGRSPPAASSVRDDGSEFSGGFFLVALDGLAGRHAGCYQGAELDDF